MKGPVIIEIGTPISLFIGGTGLKVDYTATLRSRDAKPYLMVEYRFFWWFRLLSIVLPGFPHLYFRAFLQNTWCSFDLSRRLENSRPRTALK